MKCRNCQTDLTHVFINLGSSPPSNSYLDAADPNAGEVWYPLKAFVCDHCLLVQIDEFKSHAEIFSAEYAYFSSFSKTWLEHARRYCGEMVERLGLDGGSFVAEIASNDGYLLRNFVQANIPCLGIEPSTNTAQAARAQGIETWTEFFGNALAERIVLAKGRADLVVGNNVLAHVPNLLDFVEGVKTLLKPEGTATFEFPHLLNLVRENQFDTIYHEHFSYLSLLSSCQVFSHCGLRVFDAVQLPTHGGSLRLFVCHAESPREDHPRLQEVLQLERANGMEKLDFYLGFQKKADRIKDGLLSFLLDAHKWDKKVVAYGAAAKGNTILNYAGIKPDLLPFVVDASPHKQGKLLPGSRIPVLTESELREAKPDFVLILPWNLRGEISHQLAYIRQWGGKFVTAIPSLSVFDPEEA